MSRLESAFATLKAEGKKGFIPFIIAGDPDLETTVQLLVALGQAGATVIELGVPFSDPMADGPVIQRASERALKNSFGIKEVLKTVSRARSQIETPIVLFSYFNPLLQFGAERLARDASQSGVDGILVTDLTPEESGEFVPFLSENELAAIFLVAPTSTDERLKLVAKRATGFIYAISRLGVTGTRQSVSTAAEHLVNRVRKHSDLPVAVGFGISDSVQVAQTWRFADAAVVGSAIVAEIERLDAAPDLVERVTEFMLSLIPRAEVKAGGNRK